MNYPCTTHAYDFCAVNLWGLGEFGSQKEEMARLKCDIPPEGKAGARHEAHSALMALIRDSDVTRAVEHCGMGMRPVRPVSFDKTADQNRGVPWHQDRVIASQEKAEVEEFSNWSCKAGLWDCEPPLGILHRMLFVRLHL